ncbi:hypothetical protein WN51_06318 [Melipona quadrifasciata]|uniref:Uncharacterized protein n=1 Tax=Melipona quadrifasciata TaxID=166423 RepID=A0A0M8ZQP3_9HYME|nr:hypothetical protein WN51_06318 [Melipona quadrifasciata]
MGDHWASLSGVVTTTSVSGVRSQRKDLNKHRSDGHFLEIGIRFLRAAISLKLPQAQSNLSLLELRNCIGRAVPSVEFSFAELERQRSSILANWASRPNRVATSASATTDSGCGFLWIFWKKLEGAKIDRRYIKYLKRDILCRQQYWYAKGSSGGRRVASQTKGVSVMSAADTRRSTTPEPHGGSTMGAYAGWCIINYRRCVGSHSVCADTQSGTLLIRACTDTVGGHTSAVKVGNPVICLALRPKLFLQRKRRPDS